MPLELDPNVSPWHDDFDTRKNFYRVMFQPGVPVQVRELNQLQSILQDQIEKFGDSIYKQGSIVAGCAFQFLPQFPYVKIADSQVDGESAVPSRYVGFFATSTTSNLRAFVLDSADGFETTAPDLKTLFVQYTNAGDDSNTHAFGSGEILRITDANNSIAGVTVDNGGSGFTNGSAAVFTSSIAVNTSSGAFSNGDFVTQVSTGANLQVVGVDDVTLASDGQVILRLQPRSVDLANASVAVTDLRAANNEAIRNSGNTAVGTVEWVYGTGAAGEIVTDGAGRVVRVAMTAGGSGYTVVPTARIKSANNTTGLASLDLTPLNYRAEVTIANTSAPVGNGYAFGVGEGVIYQKGFFIRVEPQITSVAKYSETPNAVSVGFRTREEIVDSDQDQSLLDNATGSPNETAPGAERLKLTPELFTANVALQSQIPGYLPICSWSEGNPYLFNLGSSYSRIGDEMARRTYESGGNFVIDKFEVTTRSPASANAEGNTFSIVVDPGTAYIDGYRVGTSRNFVIDNRKGTDTARANNFALTLNYGSWVRLADLGGVFQFSTGDTVTFYDTAKNFLSNTDLVESGNTAAVGNVVATARARSLEWEGGKPGTPEATYRLYLFDVRPSVGKNFRDAKSVVYAGSSYSGVADVVLDIDPSTSANVARVQNATPDGIVFGCDVGPILVANSIQYTYRTVDQARTFANTGLLTKDISGVPNETFPWVGVLTDDQMQDLTVTPVGRDMIATVNAAGTGSVNTTMPNCVGTSTTFATDFKPGDFVYLFSNSTVHDVKQVRTVVNNTLMVLDSNASFTGSSLGVFRMFPNSVPIPLGNRSGLAANVDATGKILTVNLGLAVQGSTTINAAVVIDIVRSGVTVGSKTPHRDQYVRINTANNVDGTTGPWCLGVPDVLRLKGVYLGTTSGVSNTDYDVTENFYVDHNHNENYAGLSWLMVRPNSGYQVPSGAWLAVRFDYFTSSGTIFNPVSYVGSNTTIVQSNDSKAVISLGANTSTWEVPEIYPARAGAYYDLLECFDFRPAASNTVAVTANSATAPVNPVDTLSFGNTADPANDKKFPKAGSTLTADLTFYQGRIDSVFLGDDSNVFVARGLSGNSINRSHSPNQPRGCIKLQDYWIPPYPDAPTRLSGTLSEVLNKRVGNERIAATRVGNHSLRPLLSTSQVETNQPRGYSHAKVGTLERRIENLEYAAGLSLLETDMNSRIIPSSVDGSQNRFKFGFFVDNFVSVISQEVTNPQYRARVAGSRMTPMVVEWAVRQGIGTVAAPDYVDSVLIIQNLATEDEAVIPQPNTPPPPPVPDLVANAWALRIDHDSLSDSSDARVILTDSVSVEVTAAGPVTLWFHVPPYTYSYFVDPDSFFIYQGGNLVNSHAEAVDLSGEEITRLQSDEVPADWFKDTQFAQLSHIGDAVSGSGKISWVNDPSQGTTYTIVSHRVDLYDHWRWGFEYPIVYAAAANSSPNTVPTSYLGLMDTEPRTFLFQLTLPPDLWSTYLGTINPAVNRLQGHAFVGVRGSPAFGGTPTDGQLLTDFPGFYMYIDRVLVDTSFQDQVFDVTVRGLKPGTRHSFFCQGIDKTSRCKPFGGNIGDPLVTDARGILRMNFYYSPSVDSDVTAQFISTVNPPQLAASGLFWSAQVQPVGQGSVTFTVSAPGSSASLSIQVGADRLSYSEQNQWSGWGWNSVPV